MHRNMGLIKYLKTNLISESIERSSLSFECVDHIRGLDCLPLGVLGVSNSISHHVLKKYSQHCANLFIDETRDPLDSSPPRKTPDSRLGDSLDVVSQYLTMALSPC